jgi:hypothetical protein
MVFRMAGIYGLLVIPPQYFLEERIGLDHPPPINHPEYFYGFLGVALAWQVAFLVIGSDPQRYRMLMLPAILEKASFGVAAVLLYAAGRIPAIVHVFGWVDLALGALFALAFWKTPPAGAAEAKR